MPSWLFQLSRALNRLWVTVGLYSALGIAAALASAQFGHLVPSDFSLKLGSDSVDDILSILASSMLAVATFSLATLVTAYTSLVGSVSPRAAELLVSDGGVRRSLATFVGAFVYSIVGIIAVHTGYYGAEGRVILFFVTLAVLTLVVLAMLRWIGQLSQLGQIGDLVGRVVAVTEKALRARPILCARASEGRPAGEPDCTLTADEVGYVQNVDLDGLAAFAERRSVRVRLEVLPGELVHAGARLVSVEGARLTDEETEELRGKIAVGARRTFEQDPRYGLTVLGEIAARALSPGVNEFGVAREVTARTVRLLAEWTREAEEPDTPPDVTVPPLGIDALLEDALGPVARYGASDPSLQCELQRALLALARTDDARMAAAARRLSRAALGHARAALKRREDFLEVRRASAPVLRGGA